MLCVKVKMFVIVVVVVVVVVVLISVLVSQKILFSVFLIINQGTKQAISSKQFHERLSISNFFNQGNCNKPIIVYPIKVPS